MPLKLNFTAEQNKVLKSIIWLSLIVTVLHIGFYFITGDNAKFRLSAWSVTSSSGVSRIVYNYSGILTVFLIWIWEGLQLKNFDLLKKMSGVFMLLILIDYFQISVINLDSYILGDNFSFSRKLFYLILDKHLLFGVFYALFKQKNHLIIPNLLVGFLLRPIIGSLGFIWYSVSDVLRPISFGLANSIGYLSIVNAYLVPLILLGIFYWIDNNYQKGKGIKTHLKLLFDQNQAIDKRTFAILFPLFYHTGFILWIKYILRSGIPFYTKNEFTLTRAIDLFWHLIYFIPEVLVFFFITYLIGTLVICRLNTLKKNITWVYFFHIVPFINLIPYYQLATTEKQEKGKLYLQSAQIENERFRNQLVALIGIILFATFLITRLNDPNLLLPFASTTLSILVFILLNLNKKIIKVLFGIGILSYLLVLIGFTFFGIEINGSARIISSLGFLLFLQIGFFPHIFTKVTKQNSIEEILDEGLNT